MKIPTFHSGIAFGASLAAIALFSITAHAATSTFNGSVSTDYGTAGNWSPSGVPNTASGDTALINNGSAVTYNAGSDIVFSNGGTLQVTNGSWTQTGGNNYIQLGAGGGGNGNIIIDGGTFNQGTASSTPFAITGTNNAFTISAGVANFNGSFNANTGMNYLQSGGIVNATSGEFDLNSLTISMTGGVLNTHLLTNVNHAGVGSLTFSGGVINLSDGTGIYSGNAAQLNFSVVSTGTANFLATGSSAVQNMINGGVISYNGATNASAFTVVANSPTSTSVFLNIPEPSTYALMGLGSLGVLFLRRKRA